MDHWADYVIFVVFLLASLGIGLYHALTGGRQRTTQEFISGNRQLKVLPTAVSMMVSFKSAISMLGMTAEIHTRGIQVWPGMFLGMVLAMVVTDRFIVPWMYPAKLLSVYEYFELRFKTRGVRLFAIIIALTHAILYMGVSIYAPSVALETATGMPLEVSIPLMAGVCVIYTSLGGMKAVIWTDVFQFLIMLGGCLAILVKAVILTGGVKEVFRLAEIEGRLDWFDWRAVPTVRHSFWAIFLGYGTTMSYTFGFQQASYQRYSAVPTVGKARLTVAVSIMSHMGLQCLFCMIGVAVVGYYSKIKCDVLSSGMVKSPNQILPFFVVEAFKGYKGFSGLFIATLYGGALSSVSSSLSGSAANVWSDLLKPHLPHITDTRAALINRILVVVLGLISIAVAFLPTVIKAPILQITLAFFGACSGPLLGMFVLSGCKCLKNRLIWQAVVIGGLVGFCLNIWLSLGANFNKGLHPKLPPMSAENCSIFGLSNFTLPATSLLSNITDSQSTTQEVSGVLRFYKLSYMLYSVFGLVSTIFVGWIISIFISMCRKVVETYTPPDTVYFNLPDLINCCPKDSDGGTQQSVEMQDKVIHKGLKL